MPDYKALGMVSPDDVTEIHCMLSRIDNMRIEQGEKAIGKSVKEIESVIGTPLPSIGDDAKVAEDVINRLTKMITMLLQRRRRAARV